MESTINFKFWNRTFGFITFLLSAIIYISTMEPTASFWDCGEFISCASKLEICHSPGNPFFLLIGRIVSLFAGENKAHIAVTLNAASAIESAATIMFLFWTITWFCRKLLASSNQMTTNSGKIIMLAAGFVGSMSYAVSDSFWFSAVEAEVYAMSSLFTALIFWCITKWDESDNAEAENRWLMLIAYLFGLGVGVHLLNLLVIPSIVVLYQLKHKPVNGWNITKAVLISSALLALILGFVIPCIPKLSAWFELIMVNSLNLPYNSGYIAGLVVTTAVILGSLYLAHRKKKVWLYNSIIYLTLILMGISSYTIIVLRSHDNPPINMNNPEDPFALEYYLNREQYEKRDLFFGPSYASPVTGSKERSSYERYNGKYQLYPLNPEYTYGEGSLMLFPRMASQSPEHVEAYKEWVDIKGRPYVYTDGSNQQQQVMLPTFGENMTFFFRYQLGFMYFRYFMWNFSGRQNDILGHGNVLHGNWITGIPIIDSALAGPQDKLPSWQKHNPGRNTYFLLPLLLGLIGLVYHYLKDNKQFIVLSLIFFFTGIAIVIFLNEVPVVPRERDYVSVGSFYAFSIWIGIGVLGLWQILRNMLRLGEKGAAIAAIALSLGVPIIMVYQNWDDHSRAHRYTVLEYARNYLESCEPNAILFTNADNDTYPLWYAQEVEGIRRDVQIILTPYLSANWYVNQMRQQSYRKAGIKMTLGKDKFVGGERTFLPIIEKIDSTVDIASLLDFVGSNDPRTQVELSDGKKVNFVPTHRLSLPMNKELGNNYRFVSGFTPTAADSLQVQLKGNYLRMDQLLLLDILATNNWKRPVYFASIQEPMNLGLDKYLQMDGYAYKLTPFYNNSSDIGDVGVIDTEKLYDKLMNQFSYASLANPAVYLDWTQVTTVYAVSLRSKFAQLAETLLKEGKTARCIAVLDRITAILPHERIPYDLHSLKIAALYLKAGQRAKAESIIQTLKTATIENLDYFQTLPMKYLTGIDYEIRVNIFTISELQKMATNNGFEDLAKSLGMYMQQLENTLLPVIQH